MAIGDYLIQLSAANTALSYVPAGSNIFMILSQTNGGQGSTEQFQINDGAGNCQLFQNVNYAPSTTAPFQTNNNFNTKVLIDNTNYYNAAAGGAFARSWFCAVQVK